MGLIDVLTQYDTKKKAAHAAKAVKHGVRDCCFFFTEGLFRRHFYIFLHSAKYKGLLSFPI